MSLITVNKFLPLPKLKLILFFGLNCLQIAIATALCSNCGLKYELLQTIDRIKGYGLRANRLANMDQQKKVLKHILFKQMGLS